MNERNLTKMSIIGISLCLFLLYVISIQNFSLNVKIGDIDKSFIGKSVNVTGEITETYRDKGNMFFDIKDETGKIKVVLWEDTLELLEINNVNVGGIKNGEKINIMGSVQLYKGELEIIPIRGNVKL